MPGALQAAINRLQTDISLTFPFSDDPVHGAFAMLLGHDVPLVKFTVNLPSLFNVQLADLIQATGVPVLGENNGLPATAELGGDLNLDVYLSGGYDTRGLRELIRNPGDVGALADGFYFDSSKPVLSAKGDLTISAGPKLGGDVSILGVTAKGEVGVEGVGDFDFDNLSLAFDDPDLDGDHTFRPFSAQDSNRNLFTATGSLSGSLSIGAYAEAELKVDGVGFDKRIDIGPQFHLDLGKFIDFTSYNDTNPFRPANSPPPTALTVEYNFAAADPFLADDNGHDDLYAYVLNDTLIVSLDAFAYPLGGGLTLYSTPMHPMSLNGVRNTVTKVILMGGEDGTTFHVVSGPAQFQIIGQGVESARRPGPGAGRRHPGCERHRLPQRQGGGQHGGDGHLWRQRPEHHVVPGELGCSHARLRLLPPDRAQRGPEPHPSRLRHHRRGLDRPRGPEPLERRRQRHHRRR